jgi:hypothetical protein
MELDDGSAQRVPDYLETLIAAVHEYGDASARIVDEDDAVFALLNAAIVGTGSNPNSHYVQLYVRNGTVVRGHYQTNPNGTRYDNYSTRGNHDPYRRIRDVHAAPLEEAQRVPLLGYGQQSADRVHVAFRIWPV